MKPTQPLAPRLDACRSFDEGWEDSFDLLVARLRRAGSGTGAPKVGHRFPDFALPDITGRLHRLSDMLGSGPIILSFNRGAWCPFCNAEIRAWSEQSDRLADLGARLVVVTAETGGRAKGLANLAGPGATVLSDADMGVALQTGLAFPIGEEIARRYAEEGIDLQAIFGRASGLLPIPATFALGPDQRVLFTFADPDFRLRAEPDDVLSILSEAMQGD
ncbi:MAG: AhpC/TSA family protein [Sediminimonas qiaohouensis]|uniref:AhpC/TSA family protein n=1 Tax=Sediminimonas qiaohouensis TaxID=552061 RepID=A0A7C9HCV0_9RHOB|nr:peroxiredoxin-like family protein [Sediminimonas qiaohouensis]MTJ05605.1 AhpC/TSA family protein [Sediminimonas qiaohouensis]